MHFCVVFVMWSVTQHKTTAAAGCSDKTKTSVFTNNRDNVSLRLFYNSLPLPRMWFVLVSNGWLDSRSNSTIRKSACAGERHVFGIYGALVNSTTPIRGNGIAKTRAFCIWLPVHKMFIVMIKANTIHVLLNSWFEEDVGDRR